MSHDDYRLGRKVRRSASRWLFGTTVTVGIALFACGGDQAPTASAVLDTNGGEVELESFLLRVGGEVIPDGQTPTVTLIRRGVLQDELARFHPPQTYQAVGPAVEVRLPFESDLPSELEISYDPSALPDGFEAENLTIFAYGHTMFDPFPDTAPELDEFPREDLAPVYTEVDSDALTATANVYRAGTYQLVALSDPMEWDLGASPNDSSEEAGSVEARREALQLGLGPIVVIDPILAQMLGEVRKQELRDLTRSSVQQSLAAYDALGFGTPPAPLVTVFITFKSANFFASASALRIIRINPLNRSNEEIIKALAHECFHLVQYWHTNPTSLTQFFWERDLWLAEGSAQWGSDVVYDVIPDQYSAPGIGRFSIPLNQRGETGISTYLYETVVFWKWLEAKYSGALRLAFTTVGALTRTVVTPYYTLVNDTPVSFNDTLRDTQTEIDLIRFFEDALYYKDFERDETGPGDLWDRLGPERDVEVSIRLGSIVLPESALFTGGAVIEVVIDATLAPSLTSTPKLIQNQPSPDALEGTIHIEFQPHANPNLAATVISRDTHQKKRVDTLTEVKEVTFPFDEGTEIVVIATDPQWQPPGTGTTSVSYHVWVEPEKSACGELPGTVHKVSTASELLPAIEQAAAGDTVLIAPGTYTLPSTELPGGGDYGGNRGALSITKELTLAGAGPDKTELRTESTDGIIWALNNAHTTFRDLTLVSIAGQGPTVPAFAVKGVERLTFCNVEVDIPRDWTEYGVTLAADIAGLPTLKRVEIVDSAFWGSGAESSLTTGFYISYGGGDQGAQVSFMVRNSQIADWGYGLFYIDRTEAYPHLPEVTLDIDDCATTFSGNRLFNVCERPPQGGMCVEKCPTD